LEIQFLKSGFLKRIFKTGILYQSCANTELERQFRKPNWTNIHQWIFKIPIFKTGFLKPIFKTGYLKPIFKTGFLKPIFKTGFLNPILKTRILKPI